jgi:hypothetical protein
LLAASAGEAARLRKSDKKNPHKIEMTNDLRNDLRIDENSSHDNPKLKRPQFPNFQFKNANLKKHSRLVSLKTNLP